MNKKTVVLASYWALFVVLPTVIFAVFSFHWLKAFAGIGVIVVVFLLAILGEHGFKIWKKFWSVE